ncbi:MAG: hypothetical protein QG656_1699 [Candidatus Hydrogenedentes bacterium]|nr:hypothetical protein [Candidatus Hydrogenedentota bacterium]
MGLLPTHADRRVFISWWKYTSRPDSFARAMGAENYFMGQGENWGLLKYLPRAWHCALTLLRRRPRLVFISNPPTCAPCLVWLYCRLFNAKYCMDSHTSAFDRPRWLFFMPVHAFMARRAIWAATTNQELTNRVDAMGAAGVVVPDIPFDWPNTSYPVDKNKFSIAFICSFDIDEPILEAFEAARRMPDVQFYVTGNAKKAAPEIHANRPENVTFTGFLSNDDYAGLVRSVSAVLVLTTLDFTMQRGGSEAISAGKPLITTNFQMLKDVFYKGTVHVNNSPESIIDAVRTIQRDRARFEREMDEMRAERQARWETIKADLEQRIAAAFAR